LHNLSFNFKLCKYLVSKGNFQKNRIIDQAISRSCLTGARQVGKSSLLKKLFPLYRYVAFDLPNDAFADQDSASFLKLHSAPLIIDEVQNAQGIFWIS
jgi:predicted AAA+ superfamily ATPase